MNRQQRRRAMRSKDIPVEVKEQIRAAKAGRPPAAAAAGGPPGGDEAVDAAPFDIEDLPPEVRKMVEQQAENAQSAMVLPAMPGSLAAGKDGKRAAKFVTLEMELVIYLSTMPAGAFRRIEDEFCVHHFEREGPAFANNLVRYAEVKPAFYRQLRGLLDRMSLVMLGIGAATYALPPLLHHFGGPDAAKRMFNVPIEDKAGDFERDWEKAEGVAA
jgi:hypothetical protein